MKENRQGQDAEQDTEKRTRDGEPKGNVPASAIRISRDTNRATILRKSEKTELLHQITGRDLLCDALSEIRLRSWVTVPGVVP
jgi:hypothetical protein